MTVLFIVCSAARADDALALQPPVVAEGDAPIEQRLNVNTELRSALKVDSLAKAPAVAHHKTADTPQLIPPIEREQNRKAAKRITTPVAIAGGATLALAVSAAVTGIMSLNASSDSRDNLTRANDATLSTQLRQDARQNSASASRNADTLALITEILVGGSIVGAGTTAVLLLSNNSKSASQERQVASARALRVVPKVSTTGASVVMTTVF